jgi:competence protein ComEA
MIARIAIVAAILALGAYVLWHPAPRPALVSAGAPSGQLAVAPAVDGRSRRRGARESAPEVDSVVYVAGAVVRPGLYHLRPGDRAARAIALAGGMRDSADAAGVNLAQRVQDGDEIDVPVVGEPRRPHAGLQRQRHRASPPPPGAPVDVNRADAAELAAVPGIGRTVAVRIVELRRREGSFSSLDELLDVAGMTQTRLERARPFLVTL